MERYLKKLTLVVCMAVALAAMVGLQAKTAWAAKEILIIRNYLTERSPGAAALRLAMEDLNKEDLYDEKNIDQFSTTSIYELSRYRIIIIAENQDPYFYDELAEPDNQSKLAEAVDQGTILLAHLYDNDPSGGQINGNRYLLPGDVGVFGAEQDSHYPTNSIKVYDTSACVLDGITSPNNYFYGIASSCGLTSSASGVFKYLQPSTEQIMKSDDADSYDGPTYIIYSRGKGQVFATTQPIEAMYCCGKVEFLRNDITCAQEQAQPGETDQMLQYIKSAVDNIASKITTLQGDVTAMKTDMTAVKGDINTMKTDMATMKSDYNSMKTDLAAVKGDAATMKGDVSTMKTDLATVKADVYTIKTQTTDIQTRVKSIESKLDSKFPVRPWGNWEFPSWRNQ